MRRVRQESAEVYEVSPVEIATALGLFFREGDTVTLEHKYGDVYRLRVAAHEDESVEMPVPMRLSDLSLEIPLPLPDFAFLAEGYGVDTPVIPTVLIPPPLEPGGPTPPVALEGNTPLVGVTQAEVEAWHRADEEIPDC